MFELEALSAVFDKGPVIFSRMRTSRIYILFEDVDLDLDNAEDPDLDPFLRARI